MVSRKLLALIVLMSAFVLLPAQEADSLGLTNAQTDGLGPVNTEQVDSLGVVPDPDTLGQIQQSNASSELEDLLKDYAPRTIDEQAILAGVSKSDVMDIIEKRRRTSFANPRHFRAFGYPNLSGAYRSSFNMIGLQTDPIYLNVEGFEMPRTLHSTWFYQGQLCQFHDLSQTAMALNAESVLYDYPVSLSRLEGSLGDYDSRYALGSFSKGNLLGLQGLSLSFDYSLFNGYWVDAPNSGNASHQLLSYRYKDLFWSVDYSAYSKNGGSYELDPAYWYLGNYRVKNQHKRFIGRFDNPLVNLSIADIRDRSSAINYALAQKSDAWQIALDRSLKLWDIVWDLRHEYRDVRRNYLPAPQMNQEDYEHKSSLRILNPHFAELELDLDLLDWEKLRLYGKLGKRFSGFNLGLYTRRSIGDYTATTAISSPLGDGMMDALDLYSPEESAVYAGLERWGIKLWAAYGTKKQEQYMPTSHYKASSDILRLAAGYHVDLGDFRFNIDSQWNYQAYDKYLVSAPEYSFFSSQSISWNLDHDNLLEAGMNLYGHSDYYLANAQNPVLIEASTLMDAWAAVRVSKLFDFNVSFRNMLSTSLYGLYPIPFSIHAGLRWFFIN